MAPRVLIIGKIFWARDVLDELLPKDVAKVVDMQSTSRSELFKDFAIGGRYSDIVGIYHEHDSSIEIVGRPDTEFIKALPPTVKWIAHRGAGYDQFDVVACKARGIGVSNTPGAVDEATATTALYLLISTMRNFSKCERSLRAGGYKPPGIEGASHDLSGRTLGILGLGSIGITFAHLVKPFNMRIVYHNRREAQDIPKDWTYYPNLEDMLTEADVLSIHMPLSDQTLGFVDEKKIRLMKPGSIIINTARGKIIDEDALINALNDGHLAAAGLDVFRGEPNIDPRLLACENATLLPHVGTENRDARRKMEILAITNLRDFLVHGKGKNLVAECR